MKQHARTISIAIVNDYPIVTAGVAGLLAPYPRFRVSQHVGSLPIADDVDVVLLDTFGNEDPPARLIEVANATGAKVLVFGWAESVDLGIEQVRRRGGDAFLAKTVDGAELAAAIEAVLGDSAVDVAAPPREQTMVAWPGQEFGLSEREGEVICLITAGLTNLDVAGAMYLSINSVKSYIRSAYRKIGVTYRSQAVLWGVDHGMRPAL